MDDPHREIMGYRELNKQEVDLINRIKEHAEATADLVDELRAIDSRGYLDPEQQIESTRCINEAKTFLQTGQMWLVQSVALQESF